MPNYINSQMSNLKTLNLYEEICLSLAENVFKYRKLPKTINKKILNETLLSDGSIAVFVDDVIGILALPYFTSKMNIYGEPIEIDVILPSGYIRHLKAGEFIILYDNNRHISLRPYVIQFAERLAHSVRVSDINIDQQKTPRVFQVPEEKMQTFKDMINNIDANVNIILGYDDLNVSDSTCNLSPAPFVADKVDEHFDKIWQEFLSFIGISSVQIEKKERLIKDEVKATLGGNLAGRFNRFEARKDGIDLINEKYNLNILCSYYDDEPTTEDDEPIIEKGGDNNVL